MAIFTVTTEAKSNQPASQLGDLTFSLDYGETFTFNTTDFTTGTNPEYIDPEGDALYSIQVLSLPVLGSLELNSVAVTALDEILVSDIDSALLTYVGDALETSGYNDAYMTFDVKDEGSLTFAGLTGKVSITMEEQTNESATIGDNSLSTSYGTSIVFTRANFTTETTPAYSDPESDSANLLRIDSLPLEGTLQLNGTDVTINQEINFTNIDSGLFTFTPNSSNSSGYDITFDYSIADTGSGIFVS